MQARLILPIKIFIWNIFVGGRVLKLGRPTSPITIQNMIIKMIFQGVVWNRVPCPFNPFLFLVGLICFFSFWEIGPVRVDHLIQYSHNCFLYGNTNIEIQLMFSHLILAIVKSSTSLLRVNKLEEVQIIDQFPIMPVSLAT